MSNKYPGSGTDGAEPVTKLTPEWFKTAPQTELLTELNDMWHQSSEGKTAVLNGVSGFLSHELMGSKEIDPSTAETIVDLNLRSVLGLMQDATNDSYAHMTEVDQLGQVCASAGGVMEATIFEDRLPAIGFATPKTVPRSAMIDAIQAIQASANNHEGKVREDVLNYMHLVQLTNASMQIMMGMMHKADMGVDDTFNSNSSYIKGNLGGLIAAGRGIGTK